MRFPLVFMLTSLLSVQLAREVFSSTSLTQSVINEKTILRRQQNPSNGNPPGNLEQGENNKKGEKEQNNKKVEKNETSKKGEKGENNKKGVKGSDNEKSNKETEGEGDNSDDNSDPVDGEDENDDSRLDDREDVTILIKEPTQGQLRVLNIPLGGQQKIRWEIPDGESITNSISVTAVLQTSSVYPIIFPIAVKLPLGKTEVLWNTSIASTNLTEQPLRPSSGWSLFIHDGALKYDKRKNNRLIAASIKFNLYSPPDVSNRFKAAGFLSSIPSLCGLLTLSFVMLSLF